MVIVNSEANKQDHIGRGPPVDTEVYSTRQGSRMPSDSGLASDEHVRDVASNSLSRVNVDCRVENGEDTNKVLILNNGVRPRRRRYPGGDEVSE